MVHFFGSEVKLFSHLFIICISFENEINLHVLCPFFLWNVYLFLIELKHFLFIKEINFCGQICSTFLNYLPFNFVYSVF